MPPTLERSRCRGAPSLATCSSSTTRRLPPTFSTTFEQLLGDSGTACCFFPRSARVPYQEEVTENANIAMRAEVLNEINRAWQSGLAIVTFAEKPLPSGSSAERELSEADLHPLH